MEPARDCFSGWGFPTAPGLSGHRLIFGSLWLLRCALRIDLWLCVSVISQESELDDQLLTTGEAAQRLGVKPNHLEKLRVVGGGPAFVKLGRSVRYEPAALQDWVASCRRRSTSQTTSSAL